MGLLLEQPTISPITAIGLMIPLSLVLYIAYNLTLHPLAKFPGPKSWAATRVPYCIGLWKGTLAADLREIHEKYGDVVRSAPGELSFISPQAFKDIYAVRPGKPQMAKDRVFYTREFSAAPDIIRSNDQEHARHRRLLAHSFSEKSLRDQEPVVQQYTELLIARLKAICGRDGIVDLTSYYNFVSFDVIGDLCFGEPFDCLNTETLHPWIDLLFQGMKGITFIQITRHFPIFTKFLRLFVPKEFIEKRQRHFQMSKEKMDRRIANKNIRESDFLTKAIDSQGTGEDPMTLDELRATANVLVLAGSETTATVMSGITYHMLKNPKAMIAARDEIDQTFSSETEMNVTSVGKLKYLNALISEGLRIYPPVPAMLPRRTGAQGDIIQGRFVPGDTVVSVSHLTAFTSSRNFKDPLSFRPERWLGDPEFATDRRDVLQPFSMGPRNCIGKNLASMEMKNVLARMLWYFDIELLTRSDHWYDQVSFLLWDKPALEVKLSLRKGKF